jgi:hypothetical protein
MKSKSLLAGLLVMAILIGSVAGGTYAATQGEIEQSIAEGIDWLVAEQQDNGSWDWDDQVARTAFAVVKLEDLAFELGQNPFDEDYLYSENVIAGLDYIFSRAQHPTTCCEEHVVFAPGHSETYNTGIAMMAIAASKAPDRVVNVSGSLVDGWTYRQVLQANVDYFACSQIDSGGWRYECGEDWADNSATGYVTLGLAYAEAPLYGFQCSISDSLKEGLNTWIDANQVSGDTPHNGGSGYGAYDNTSNLLRAGNLIFEMAFMGDTPETPRMQRALDYVGRAWEDPDWSWWDIHSYPGWYGNPDWHGEPVHQEDPPDWWQGLEERWWGWQGPHYQAMYCLMKGLSFAGVNTILVDSAEVDWYQAFADRILETQADDGSWHRDYWGGRTLATEWALLTLERVAPPRVVPVDIKPQSCPNPINTKDKGRLPVAILGSETFDVTQIDPTTIRLEHLAGVSPVTWALEDTATPYEPYTGKEDIYDCTEDGPDGYLDLVVMFDTQELIAALGEMHDGDVLVLHLTGNLMPNYGGTPIAGEDIVWIIKKGKH